MPERIRFRCNNCGHRFEAEVLDEDERRQARRENRPTIDGPLRSFAGASMAASRIINSRHLPNPVRCLKRLSRSLDRGLTSQSLSVKFMA